MTKRKTPGAWVLGFLAERDARRRLQKAGMRIIACNYQCRCGEIDLIAQSPSELVFVEVRYRSRSSFGGAAESISRSKQQKIIRSAANFLMRHPEFETLPCRFDVLIYENRREPEWIVAAFDGDLC
jgi:putative endonuclease